MIHRALKSRRPAWLQLPSRETFTRPLSLLILAALLLSLLGIWGAGRLAVFFTSPNAEWYGADLSARGRADYSFWPFGLSIPPISTAAVPLPTPASDPNALPPPPGPVEQQPVAEVQPPTSTPTATTAPASPTVPTVPPATETAQPPSATPTRTATVSATRAPSATPRRVASPLPTNTAQVLAPSPTNTQIVVQPPPPNTATRTVTATASATRTATATVTATRTRTPTNTPRPATAVPPTATATRIPTATATATPLPPEPAIRFVRAALTAAENSGNVTIAVELNQPATQPVQVRYRARGGTATANVDYRLNEGILRFAAGSSQASFTLQLIADTLDEAPETIEVQLFSPDGGYLVGANPLILTIADTTDPPEIRFAQAAATVAESAGTVSLPIELSLVSALDVSVPYTIGGSAALSDHSLRNGTLFIPSGSSGALLRVTISDDQIDEDDETLLVTLGTPTNALLDAPASYSLTIRDDDTAGVRANLTNLSLAEGGPALNYALVLESRPVGNVLITISGAPQAAVNPSSLTFTPNNWNIAQGVSVQAINDDIDEADSHAGRIVHVAAGGDPRYDGIAVDPINLTIADNDTAGVTVSARTPSIIGENGGRSTYALRLNSQPTSPVTITLTSDGFSTTAPTQLRFSAADWNQPKSVTITAKNDTIDRASPYLSTITHTAASADANYRTPLLNIANATVSITDDDISNLIVDPLQLGPIAENGATVTYTLRLQSQPIAPVTIALSSDGLTSVISPSVVLDALNWQNGVTVTARAVADAIDRGDLYSSFITHTTTSADANYNQATVIAEVRITDDDTAGVNVSAPTPASIAEDGGIATYTLSLNSQPTSPVTIVLVADSFSTVEPASVVLDAANWQAGVTISASAVADAIDRGDLYTSTITHTATSDDANYNQATATAQVQIADDDAVGVNVAPLQLGPIAEDGGTATYTLSLDSEPLAPVTIALSSDGLTSVISPSVVLDAANWQAGVTITVSAVLDQVDRGDLYTSTITHVVSSADGLYNGIAAADATVEIEDDDNAGVIVSAVTPASIIENSGTATYTLSLDSEPTNPVTIALTSDGLTSLSSPSVLLDAENWLDGVTITVTARPDRIDRGGIYTSTIAHTVTSADGLYNGIAADDATVEIQDDDSAGVNVSAATPALIIENSGTATYTLSLDSQPLAPVTIALTSDGLTSLNPASVVLNAANWQTGITITVTSLNDQIDRGDAYTSTIAHTVTSADGLYNGIAADDATVRIEDDDDAGVIVTLPPGGLVLTEGGAGVSYTLKLNSEPLAPVTIAITSPDNQLAALPASLIFTAANWNDVQTVLVSAVDDPIDEPDQHSGSLNQAVISSDPRYNAIAVAPLTGIITDNDTASILLSETTLSLTENDSVVYSVRLNSQPLAPVTVTISATGEPLTIAPTTLVFTSANWNTPQPVTLSAPDDAIAEADLPTTISHSASSGDPNYQITNGPELAVTVIDDDSAGLLITPLSLNVIEGGQTATYSVTLSSEPLAPVTLNIAAAAGQVSANPPALSFGPGNWNIAQIVTVSAADDGLSEANPHTDTLRHSTSSSDPNYQIAAIDNPVVNVNILDPLRITITDISRFEGNTGLTNYLFPVQLSRASTRSIVVNYEIVDANATQGSDYITPSGLYSGSLTFAPGSVNGTIQVQVNGDTVFEPDEVFLVRLTSVNIVGSGETVQLSDTQGVGLIRNDDQPTLSYSRLEFTAGESSGSATITLRLSGPAAVPVEVDYATIDSGALAGSATLDSDYTGVSGRLIFAPGVIEQSVTITILNDAIVEPRFETVKLRLSNATGALISSDTAILTIVDDDQASPDVRTDYFQTAGASWDGDGWNYYATNGGYTYLRIDVPCTVAAGTLRFDLLNPAMDTTSPRDNIRNGADSTTFELYRMPAGWSATDGLPGPGAAGSVAQQTFAPSALASATLYSSPVPAGCGTYLLRVATATDDTNGWGIQVGYENAGTLRADQDGIPGSGDEILVGVQQATARLNAALSPDAPTCETIYEYVQPGLSSVTFHNFDLDGVNGRVRYYPPDSLYDPRGLEGGIAGTASLGGAWNNGTATTRGGDVIADPAAGWWRIVTCNLSATVPNLIIQEGQTDVAAYFLQPPTPELTLAMTPAAADVVVGATVDVTLNYANPLSATSGAAINSILTVTMPPELSYVGCSGATCNLSGSLLTIDLGLLPAGTNGTITLTLRANSGTGGNIAALRVDGAYRDLLNNRFAARALTTILIN